MVNTAILKGKIYAAGYTIKTLADEMGIEYNLFSKKVCGRIGFSAKQVLKLCELLHLTGDEAHEIFLPEDVTESEQ